MIAKKGNIHAKKYSQTMLKTVDILNNLGNNISAKELINSIKIITTKEEK